MPLYENVAPTGEITTADVPGEVTIADVTVTLAVGLDPDREWTDEELEQVAQRIGEDIAEVVPTYGAVSVWLTPRPV